MDAFTPVGMFKRNNLIALTILFGSIFGRISNFSEENQNCSEENQKLYDIIPNNVF